VLPQLKALRRMSAGEPEARRRDDPWTRLFLARRSDTLAEPCHTPAFRRLQQQEALRDRRRWRRLPKSNHFFSSCRPYSSVRRRGVPKDNPYLPGYQGVCGVTRLRGGRKLYTRRRKSVPLRSLCRGRRPNDLVPQPFSLARAFSEPLPVLDRQDGSRVTRGRPRQMARPDGQNSI